MEQQPSSQRPTKSQGLPLWNVLVGALILAVVAVVALVAVLYLIRKENTDLTKQDLVPRMQRALDLELVARHAI